MNHVMKKLPLVFVLLLLVTTATGCFNIFGFTSDKELSPVEKAEEAIRDGDYAKARQELEGAGQDSTDVMVLYTNAKVALLDAGINLAQIVDLIEGQEDAVQGESLALLDIIDDLSTAEQNGWYRGNIEAATNLKLIYKEKISGLLNKEDISLDYTVSNVISGVLRIRDTDSNGIIDDNDFTLNIEFVTPEDIEGIDIDGFVFDGGSYIDDSGNEVLFEGLTAFLGDWNGSNVTPKMTAPAARYTPEDINRLIFAFLTVISEGSESIKFLIENSFKNSSFEIEDIDEFITEIAVIINYYWYNDGIDNDADGQVDEEMIDGKDNDGDGLIDEDTDHVDYWDPDKENDPSHDHSQQEWKELYYEILSTIEQGGITQ